MKGLSAGLTFVNISTVSALLLGLAAGGLSPVTAALSLVLGGIAAVAAYLRTFDPERGAHVLAGKEAPGGTATRYGSVWFWILAAFFAIFAVRSFGWLLYMEGDSLMIQSVNNLGDLALHITYIRDFAKGAALWPINPIFPEGHLRYPAGTDLFNALLYLVHVDLIRGLVWTGLAGSLATFYALFRWGKGFAVAAFLFNGGIIGFQFLNSWQFLDYQGLQSIAWKSIPLALFVTQRGWLYAIPAGLLLLWHWREKFFRRTAPQSPAPLPFWVELSLYASMPLFHVHTFLALTFVLASLFALGDPQMRGHVLTLIASAFLPATFLVWIITDHFHAGSILDIQAWWVQRVPPFAMHFVGFWWTNFGLWFPLIFVLLGFCGWRAWNKGLRWGEKVPEEIAFIVPAILIFVFGLFIKTAPWGWDNLKIMIWGYFLVLPYLWSELIARWPVPIRVSVCIALFGSGFISLFGGLASTGYDLASRAEVDNVGRFTQNLPVDARFAAFPTYNHPLLLQGRNVVLGYGGHLWTQGFESTAYGNALQQLMNGQGDWRATARRLHARYLFWGREETLNYKDSTRPWEAILTPIAKGDWGAIYDLEQGRSSLPPR
jgi:hypothetical protein